MRCEDQLDWIVWCLEYDARDRSTSNLNAGIKASEDIPLIVNRGGVRGIRHVDLESYYLADGKSRP